MRLPVAGPAERDLDYPSVDRRVEPSDRCKGRLPARPPRLRCDHSGYEERFRLPVWSRGQIAAPTLWNLWLASLTSALHHWEIEPRLLAAGQQTPARTPTLRGAPERVHSEESSFVTPNPGRKIHQSATVFPDKSFPQAQAKNFEAWYKNPISVVSYVP